jgi:hypothetical protein
VRRARNIEIGGDQEAAGAGGFERGLGRKLFAIVFFLLLPFLFPHISF